jgi:hypothetical protein
MAILTKFIKVGSAVGRWGYENFLLMMGIGCLYRSNLYQFEGLSISSGILTLAAAVFLVGQKLVDRRVTQPTVEINGGRFTPHDDHPSIYVRRAA